MGGPGLVLLGIADNSVIPLTGSMDVLTIWLAARHHEPWPYYALMATLGAVIGGYITYALARKGGEEAMERKLSKKRAAQFSKAFARWGFAAVVFPPCCRLHFHSSRFCWRQAPCSTREEIPDSLSAWPRSSLFRRGRLGFHFGRHILRFFSQYYKPAMAVLVGLAVIGAVLTLIQYLRYKKK